MERRGKGVGGEKKGYGMALLVYLEVIREHKQLDFICCLNSHSSLWSLLMTLYNITKCEC